MLKFNLDNSICQRDRLSFTSQKIKLTELLYKYINWSKDYAVANRLTAARYQSLFPWSSGKSDIEKGMTEIDRFLQCHEKGKLILLCNTPNGNLLELIILSLVWPRHCEETAKQENPIFPLFFNSRFYHCCNKGTFSRWWRNSLWASKAESRLRIRAGWAMGSVWSRMCTFHFPLRPSYSTCTSLIVKPWSSSHMLPVKRKGKLKVDGGLIAVTSAGKEQVWFQVYARNTVPTVVPESLNSRRNCLNATWFRFCLLS